MLEPLKLPDESQPPEKGHPASQYPMIGGLSSELVELPDSTRPGTQNRSPYRVVILPGNPGNAYFYLEFAQHLRQELGDMAAVSILSHKGHQLYNFHGGRIFSLQEQIDCGTQYIQGLDQGVPVYVVGHSIGAHMGLELLRQNPTKIQGAVALFPFLQVDWASKKQNEIWFLLKTRVVVHLVSFVALLISLLPIFIQRLVFRMLVTGGFSPVAAEVTRRCMTQPLVVRNAAYMAHTEFEGLDRKPDWNFIKLAAHKIVMLFTPDDHWGPMWMHNEVKDRVPAVTNEVCEGVKHGFCTSTQQSVKVAVHTAALIRKLVASSQSPRK